MLEPKPKKSRKEVSDGFLVRLMGERGCNRAPVAADLGLGRERPQGASVKQESAQDGCLGTSRR